MLVLSREKGQSIIIDGSIRIKVLDVVEDDGVEIIRLGIDAPEQVRVDREEIHWKRKAKGQEP